MGQEKIDHPKKTERWLGRCWIDLSSKEKVAYWKWRPQIKEEE